jgi:Fuc2NAc and GlcNAc transferase
MNTLLLSSISFSIGLLVTGAIERFFSSQLLDIPNDRSSHTQPTPRGGGLGFIVAFAIATSIATLAN